MGRYIRCKVLLDLLHGVLGVICCSYFFFAWVGSPLLFSAWLMALLDG